MTSSPARPTNEALAAQDLSIAGLLVSYRADAANTEKMIKTAEPQAKWIYRKSLARTVATFRALAQYSALRSEADALRAEVERLRADAERLDWLSEQHEGRHLTLSVNDKRFIPEVSIYRMKHGDDAPIGCPIDARTVREAIDAARAALAPAPETAE
jgi:hypothetical protein